MHRVAHGVERNPKAIGSGTELYCVHGHVAPGKAYGCRINRGGHKQWSPDNSVGGNHLGEGTGGVDIAQRASFDYVGMTRQQRRNPSLVPVGRHNQSVPNGAGDGVAPCKNHVRGLTVVAFIKLPPHSHRCSSHLRHRKSGDWVAVELGSETGSSIP